MKFFQRLFGRSSISGATTDGYTDSRLGLVFPLELGGLRRLAMGREYAEGDRAGESIPYGGDGTQATIYVTTIAQAQFPDGGDSDFIRAEVESAMAAVREMERLARYRAVKFFGAEPERLGTDPGNLIWARGAFFAMTEQSPMLSFTYITALRSTLIKLRISTPDPKNKKLMEFPHALGDLIARQSRGMGKGR